MDSRTRQCVQAKGVQKFGASCIRNVESGPSQSDGKVAADRGLQARLRTSDLGSIAARDLALCEIDSCRKSSRGSKAAAFFTLIISMCNWSAPERNISEPKKPTTTAIVKPQIWLKCKGFCRSPAVDG